MGVFPPFTQRQRCYERATHTTHDKGHGRVEVRTLTSTIGLNGYLQWPGVKQVCRVQRVRRRGNQQTTETKYYITSLSEDRAKPDQLLKAIREHWGAIENGLHYVRDEAFGEDRSTIRTGHAPQNLAALRNGVLNWLHRNDYQEITPTLRSFARNPLRLLAMFGYPN